MIGAGSSGIAALKGLHERGIPVECFEKSDRVGGKWVFANRNRMSSADRSLHANTSRDRMQYSDFVCPVTIPTSPITPRSRGTLTSTPATTDCAI